MAVKEKAIPPFQHFKIHTWCLLAHFVPTDLKGIQVGVWNNPCSSWYKIIPPTCAGVEGVRLLEHTGMHPMHHGHVWAGESKVLVTVGSREVGTCRCVHSFPEHLGTLHIGDLFFTCEDIFFHNWEIKVCFCSVSTEGISNSMLEVSQAAITFKWGLAGTAYSHKETFLWWYKDILVSSVAWHSI